MSTFSADLDGGVPVALAILDPSDLTFVWCNEVAVALLAPAERQRGVVGRRLDDVMPVAPALGLTDTLRDVVSHGDPRHLTTHRIGRAHGSLTIRGSAYRLPSGVLLLVAQHG